jgi:methyl-accepting chemotaxis protein
MVADAASGRERKTGRHVGARDRVGGMSGEGHSSTTPGADLAERLRAVVSGSGVASVGDELITLAAALEHDDVEQLSSWSELDLVSLAAPDALATATIERDGRLRSYENLRGILIFAPIAITWLAIALAARAYATLPLHLSEYRNVSFIALWERGFPGSNRISLRLFHVGLIDFGLIAAVVVLTGIIGRRRNRLEQQAATNVDQLRGILIKVQRHLVGYREHGTARFRAALTEAVKDLGELTSQIKRAGDKAQDLLNRSEAAVGELGNATTTLHRAVDSVHSRVDRLTAAVEVLSELEEMATRVQDEHAASLREVAAFLEKMSNRATDASQALGKTNREVASSLGELRSVLADATRTAAEMAAVLSEEGRAHQAFMEAIRHTTEHFQGLTGSVSVLNGAVDQFTEAVAKVDQTLAGAANMVPKSMSEVARVLMDAGEQLRSSVLAYERVVEKVNGVGTGLENLVTVVGEVADLYRLRADLGSSSPDGEVAGDQ